MNTTAYFKNFQSMTKYGESYIVNYQYDNGKLCICLDRLEYLFRLAVNKVVLCRKYANANFLL